MYSNSPATPHRSNDSCHCQGRYLLLDPRVSDADGRAGRDEWWFVIERNWPSGFDPQAHGDWGRLVNFHNVAGDVGWDSGSGVSALALDWLSGASAPQFSLEYHDGGKPHYLPTPSRDAFHTYVVHFIAGRTDGTTPRPGALTVWADGADSPAIDLGNINTLQRADGATQKWMQLWEGDYTRDLPSPRTQSFVLTRVGATLAEALADRPIATGRSARGSSTAARGTTWGRRLRARSIRGAQGLRLHPRRLPRLPRPPRPRLLLHPRLRLLRRPLLRRPRLRLLRRPRPRRPPLRLRLPLPLPRLLPGPRRRARPRARDRSRPRRH